MRYILSIVLVFLMCSPAYSMKLRVMGEIIATRNPVDYENLLVGKATKRKVIKLVKRTDGQEVLQIDVVAEDDADTNKFFRDCKTKVTQGKFHIHQCFHKEFGEPEDKPCVIIEEITIP